MRVHFCAKRRVGSFICRAEQIAAQRPDWTASLALGQADVVVVTKHPDEAWSDELRNRKWVWDCLDFWMQPHDDVLNPTGRIATKRFLATVQHLRPSGVIFPTQAMREDLSAVLPEGVEVEVIPHHWKPGLSPSPIAERVTVIGYEGDPQYLGEWKSIFERLAAQMGAAFVINPHDLSQADILVAARGKTFRSWMTRRWKSGVKAANAIGAGIPGLMMDEAGTLEVARDGGVLVFEDVDELAERLQLLADPENRRKLVESATHRQSLSVEASADKFATFLTRVHEAQPGLRPQAA